MRPLANGKKKKQQAHCGRASRSRTKVVQDHPSSPLSIRTADARMGMNPLRQEQSLVSGENRFLFLRPAYETWIWGAEAQKETPQDPSPRNSAPSRGWGRSSFTYAFYSGARSPHKEYNIYAWSPSAIPPHPQWSWSPMGTNIFHCGASARNSHS